MHMADALISPTVAGTMYACSAAAAGYSIRKVRLEADPKKVPVMGVMGAFVFAAQMINFTIPGTGSSGHLCGGMLLTALLGPYAAFLTMIGVLLIQCLMFADGGLLALGCNVWNMAFYGCFIGYFLIWRPMTNQNISRGRIIAGSIIGSMLSLQMGAFSVTIETLLSGITDLPFSVFVATMQPIHLAIGMVEGFITAAVLVFVYESRPEMLYQVKTIQQKERMSAKKILAILGICTLIIAGGVSLFASSHPDGLEWSIEKITGDTELEAPGDSIYQGSQSVQESTAVLPDYGFKRSDSSFGTTFSGIAGAVVVLILCGGVCAVITYLNKKNRKKQATKE